MRLIYLVASAFCVILSGCDRAALMKKVTPPEDESLARRHVDLLRQHAFDQIERDLDPKIVNSNVSDTLTGMAAMFPAEEPNSIKVVAVKFFSNQESSAHSLTLEYEFPSKWLLVNMVIQRKQSASTIVAFNVTPISESLEDLNRFTFVGKSAPQYLVLGIAVIAQLFCLYVLVMCVRAKKERLKLLWAIFILCGVGKLAVNWTTGELMFTPLTVNIPCASATAVPAYGPWVVAVFLPLGAILFLLKQKKYTALNDPNSSSTTVRPQPLSQQ